MTTANKISVAAFVSMALIWTSLEGVSSRAANKEYKFISDLSNRDHSPSPAKVHSQLYYDLSKASSFEVVDNLFKAADGDEMIGQVTAKEIRSVANVSSEMCHFGEIEKILSYYDKTDKNNGIKIFLYRYLKELREICFAAIGKITQEAIEATEKDRAVIMGVMGELQKLKKKKSMSKVDEDTMIRLAGNEYEDSLQSQGQGGKKKKEKKKFVGDPRSTLILDACQHLVETQSVIHQFFDNITVTGVYANIVLNKDAVKMCRRYKSIFEEELLRVNEKLGSRSQDDMGFAFLVR